MSASSSDDVNTRPPHDTFSLILQQKTRAEHKVERITELKQKSSYTISREKRVVIRRIHEFKTMEKCELEDEEKERREQNKRLLRKIKKLAE